MTENQNPEQKARDKIDALLKQAGWKIQDKKKIDLNDGSGQAVREFQTDIGPADYVLFVDKKAVGVIEAKRAEEGQNITAVEFQSEGYAVAKLKWVNNKKPLPFIYESTGILVRFTDGRDPKPRSREVFNFQRPETLREWLTQSETLRGRLQRTPPLNPQKLPAKDLKLRDCRQPISELTALVALIRRVCGMDQKLSTFDDTVRRNFQTWVLKHHSGGGKKFNEEQMNWLRMIRDHVASSIHMERDDLEMTPFDGQGGLGKMHQLFGTRMDALISELNEVLAA